MIICLFIAASPLAVRLPKVEHVSVQSYSVGWEEFDSIGSKMYSSTPSGDIVATEIASHQTTMLGRLDSGVSASAVYALSSACVYLRCTGADGSFIARFPIESGSKSTRISRDSIILRANSVLAIQLDQQTYAKVSPQSQSSFSLKRRIRTGSFTMLSSGGIYADDGTQIFDCSKSAQSVTSGRLLAVHPFAAEAPSRLVFSTKDATVGFDPTGKKRKWTIAGKYEACIPLSQGELLLNETSCTLVSEEGKQLWKTPNPWSKPGGLPPIAITKNVGNFLPVVTAQGLSYLELGSGQLTKNDPRFNSFPSKTAVFRSLGPDKLVCFDTKKAQMHIYRFSVQVP